MNHSRRSFTGACLAAALACVQPVPLHAQDVRESTAQAAARSWLQAADRLDASGSWNAAGDRFKKAMTLEQWSTALKEARGALGAVQQRASVSTQFLSHLEGVPDGDYAILVFRTAFEKKPAGGETVLLEHGTDGQWRVIGYTLSQ